MQGPKHSTDVATDPALWLLEELLGEGRIQARDGSPLDAALGTCADAGLLNAYDHMHRYAYYALTDEGRATILGRFSQPPGNAPHARDARFPNLAGSAGSDATCLAELAAAGVTGVRGLVGRYGEPNTDVVGLIGHDWLDDKARSYLTGHPQTVDMLAAYSTFTLSRAWYYWVVVGLVPQSVAEAIHADPRNRGMVRVNGHAGAPPPDGEQLSRRKVAGHRCIETYHIESPLGLRLFAEHVRWAGLA